MKETGGKEGIAYIIDRYIYISCYLDIKSRYL